jgi:hypothetical protein
MAPGMHSFTLAESERRELSRISSSTVALSEVTRSLVRKHTDEYQLNVSINRSPSDGKMVCL